MICNNLQTFVIALVPPSDFFVFILLACAGIVIIGRLLHRRSLRKKNRLDREAQTKNKVAIEPLDPVLVAKLNKELEPSGFAYEPFSDIFYSVLNCWQRKYGYCRLYDEASATLSMIIDCEPIYFKYDGKRWLIELWKGQYGMTTGGEIGVYRTEKNELNLPGFFMGTLYESASDEEFLQISFTLKKQKETLFRREGFHWWLTGFVLGEFSEPSELTMEAQITLKNSEMCEAFLKGLQNAGYTKDEYAVLNNTVYILYDKPHSLQPFTRTSFTDHLTQKRNKDLCDLYQFATKDFDNIVDKLEFIREQSPVMYEKILTMGSPAALYDDFDIIKRYFSDDNPPDKSY